MVANKIIFITLSVANKLRVVCDLVEQEYMNSNRVVINVADEDEGRALDKMLWTWKQSASIPHSYISDISNNTDDPVLITDQVDKNMSYDILILVAPVSIENFHGFQKIIDFAEKYNPTKIIADRERFKTYRENKLSIETCNPGEYLHK